MHCVVLPLSLINCAVSQCHAAAAMPHAAHPASLIHAAIWEAAVPLPPPAEAHNAPATAAVGRTNQMSDAVGW